METIINFFKRLFGMGTSAPVTPIVEQEPVVVPEPEPVIEYEPVVVEPEPEPEPEVVVEPEPEPEPEPVVEPEPKLVKKVPLSATNLKKKTKKQVEDYAKQEFGIDLDRRKTKANMISDLLSQIK